MSIRMGSRGDDVKAIQNWLLELKCLQGEVDGVFGPETEKAVIRFQESAGLYADGIIGPVTYSALEQAVTIHHLEMESPGYAAVEGHPLRFPFIKMKADRYEDGYDFVWLRQDAAQAYQEVYTKVHELGGKLTSSGGRRSLYAEVNPNRSAMSFHYLGLALDLYVWSGMIDPTTDPYVVRRASETTRRFEVFFRSENETVHERELDNVVTYKFYQWSRRVTVTGRFVNLTEIFDEKGFKPISGRKRFFERGEKMAAEWWHFQYENKLCPKLSTFGGELLKVYSEQELSQSVPWRYRHRVFGIDWSPQNTEE